MHVVIAAGVQFPADSALTAAFQMIEMFFILKDKGKLDADGSGQLSRQESSTWSCVFEDCLSGMVGLCCPKVMRLPNRCTLCMDAGKVPMVWVWTGPVVLL